MARGKGRARLKLNQARAGWNAKVKAARPVGSLFRNGV